MTKPANLTPQEKLQSVAEWNRWLAGAIQNVSFDRDGRLVIRAFGIATPRSVNPARGCPRPDQVAMKPGEVADLLTDLAGWTEEVLQSIQTR
jgi:hypothetical protein